MDVRSSFDATSPFDAFMDSAAFECAYNMNMDMNMQATLDFNTAGPPPLLGQYPQMHVHPYQIEHQHQHRHRQVECRPFPADVPGPHDHGDDDDDDPEALVGRTIHLVRFPEEGGGPYETDAVTERVWSGSLGQCAAKSPASRIEHGGTGTHYHNDNDNDDAVNVDLVEVQSDVSSVTGCDLLILPEEHQRSETDRHCDRGHDAFCALRDESLGHDQSERTVHSATSSSKPRSIFASYWVNSPATPPRRHGETCSNTFSDAKANASASSNNAASGVIHIQERSCRTLSRNSALRKHGLREQQMHQMASPRSVANCNATMFLSLEDAPLCTVVAVTATSSHTKRDAVTTDIQRSVSMSTSSSSTSCPDYGDSVHDYERTLSRVEAKSLLNVHYALL